VGTAVVDHASANLHLLDISIGSGRASIGGSISVKVHAPNDENNGRISLATMKDQLTSSSYASIISAKFTPVAALQLVDIQTGIAFFDSITGGIQVNVTALPNQQFDITQLSNLASIKYNVTSNSALEGLQALNVSSVLDVVIIVLDFLSGSKGFMNNPVMQYNIPLLGVRPANMITFADRAAHVIKSLSTATPESMQKLQGQLQTLWGPSVVVGVTYIEDTTNYYGNISNSGLTSVIISFDYQITANTTSRFYMDLPAMAQGQGSTSFHLIRTNYNTI
jgi:hypothetical protein